MAAVSTATEQMPVVRDLADFDRNSGNRLERLVFNNRLAFVMLCVFATFLLAAFAAAKLTLTASFEKMIPQGQPYIRNYLEHKQELRGLGNALRIVVETTDGDIYAPKYLEALKRVSDALALTRALPQGKLTWSRSRSKPNRCRWSAISRTSTASRATGSSGSYSTTGWRW